MSVAHPLTPLAQRLTARLDVSQEEVAALLAVPHQERRLSAGASVVKEGERTNACLIVLSGYAHRHRFSAKGLRHIISIHGAGDILNLPSPQSGPSEDCVQALTPLRVAAIPLESMLALRRAYPAIADGLWAEAETELSIARGWIANMGRRDAKGRIAHIICEIVARSCPDGGFDGCVVTLPLSQADLADATGMTTVHVNRTLRALEQEAMILRERRRVTIPTWRSLAELAEFKAIHWAPRRAG